jgi:xanthosine utilization system XapX-like protein
MMSLVCGLIALAAGVYGMIQWHQALLQVLKGAGPLCVALAGLVAIVVGLASLSPTRTSSVLEKDD